MLLSDNYFDMDAGEKRVQVLQGSMEGLYVRSMYSLMPDHGTIICRAD